MKGRALLVLASAALLGAGCDDDGVAEPVPYTQLTGTWSGTAQARSSLGTGTGTGVGGNGGTVRVELVLREDGEGRVAGAGAFSQTRSGGTLAGRDTTVTRVFEVEGVNAFPGVALTLRSGGGVQNVPDLVLLDAEFATREALEGRLRGGGFDDARLRIRRDGLAAAP
jgi:hypothetical protein